MALSVLSTVKCREFDDFSALANLRGKTDLPGLSEFVDFTGLADMQIEPGELTQFVNNAGPVVRLDVDHVNWRIVCQFRQLGGYEIAAQVAGTAGQIME